MEILIMTLQLILSLSILIVLHEFGHFIAARAFGIKVEKFYMFFDAWGFKLFSYKKGDTEYGIGWLPLGGYVKIAGMIDESMDKEQLKKPAEDWEFRSKPAWQRLIVMIGGVTMNVILGIIIFSFNIAYFEKAYIPMDEVNKTGIYAYDTGKEFGFETGDKILAVNDEKVIRFNDAASLTVLFGAKVTIERNGQKINIQVPDSAYRTYKDTHHHLYGLENFTFSVDSVPKGSNAYNAGLKAGDKFISVANKKINTYGPFKELLQNSKNKTLQFVILRNQIKDTLKIAVDSNGLLGFFPSKPKLKTKEYSLGEALVYGTADAMETMIVNIKGFGKIFNGQEKATESLQGPISIAKMFGPIWDWHKFWRLTGMISMVLAFMNILPIPALDGGHVVFALYEIVTRRKPSDKFLEYAQVVGMVILLALMVFAFGNDLFKIFFK